MGVGYASKMWGSTWLSPHPRPLILRMLLTLRLYPAQNVGSTWSKIWINTLTLGKIVREQEKLRMTFKFVLVKLETAQLHVQLLGCFAIYHAHLHLFCIRPKATALLSCDWTSNKVHHEWQWLAVMTHSYLHELLMVGVDKHIIIYPNCGPWTITRNHYGVFSHISVCNGKTKAWCWLAWKRHLSMKQR
jgi:hypothetical protein